MKRLLILVSVIGFLVASFVTPLKAQWVVAYTPPSGGLENLYFVDSLHGWFVGTFTINLTYYRNLYTSDGGYTFTPQASPTGSYNLYCIFFEDTLTGWSGGGPEGNSPGVILKTTDGGANWIRMTIPGPKSGWATIAKYGNTVWFVGSANSGTNWITTNVGSQIEVQAIRFVDNNLGYALGTMQGQDGYLYRTTDGGFTWTEYYTWLAQGWKPALSVIPSTNVIFVGGGLDGAGNSYGIIKSSDAGGTWEVVYQEPGAGGSAPRHIQTPDLQHGWATNALVLRYDYVVPPTVEPIPNQLTQLGELFSYQVQATGMGLKYTMSGEPAGLSIGYYSGLIQGTPTEGGNFPVTVAVKDTDANVVNAQFNLRVNRKPIFLPPFPSTHAWVDSVYQFTLSVEDADDDTVDFVWLSKPDWLTFLTTGITSVVISGVPTINDTGYTDISVMTSDGYGGQDTLSWMLHVELYVPGNNAPYFIPPWPDTLAYVDSVYDAILYAEDIDGDSLYFDWLTKPSWLAMLDVMGTARIQGTPAISDTGYHPVSVMVDDNRGGSDTLNWIIQVINIPPPVNNIPQFVGSWPDTLVVYRDSTYNWDFLFQDIDGDTLFAIPGDIGVPGLTLLPGSGVGEVTAIVTGNPTDTGWYTVLVSVKDEHGGQGQLQLIVHVDFPTSVEPLPGIPTEFSLEQNYPNPFNPVTIIRYALPHNTEVNLTIYNLLGQEVEILINEYQPAGTYEASFNASALPSGT